MMALRPQSLLPKRSWNALIGPTPKGLVAMWRLPLAPCLTRRLSGKSTILTCLTPLYPPSNICAGAIQSKLAVKCIRCFSTTPNNYRDHHFDTLKFVQRLRSEGFSEEQSKAMMLVLSDVIEESIQNLTRTMVLKEGNSGRKDFPIRLHGH